MRILQLLYSRNFAGTEHSVLTLSKALVEAGHEVVIAVKDKGILKEIYRRNNLRVATIPINTFLATRRIGDRAKQNKVNIIHAHLTEGTRMACKIHQRTQIPIVAHLRILRDDPAYRKAAQNGLLIANSSYTARFYEEAGIPPGKIRTIPNATGAAASPVASTPKAALAAYFRHTLKLPAGARLISLPGRIASEKGHATLLRAMPEVLKKHPKAHVLIPGNLKQKPIHALRLFALQKQLSLKHNVHFLGFRTDVLAITRASEIQLVPSCCEPFGLVAIEAMAMETPVIGADSGAIPDILENQTLGTLFPYDDHAALAGIIISALDNPAPFQAKTALAKTRVLEIYNPATLAARVIAVYEELLKPSPAA